MGAGVVSWVGKLKGKNANRRNPCKGDKGGGGKGIN
ncbi:hypothetical protein UFOVP583_10 [uncultured Caudovirales phage]|uniref:Uncharacterized protein n=1 Tax=uncultured Caudovirales phage TaxID=2100421 RepID=A0A6J5MVM7_9CAUD|nr:hypothetical protein UFOVP583_10 [uncultured Caudovirales phage]